MRVCIDCGSPDVDQRLSCWIPVNAEQPTIEQISIDPESGGDLYCNACQGETTTAEVPGA